MATVREVVIGEKPWAIFNLTDFILIGLMSILFLQMLNVFGMSWHRYALWRATGSAVSAPPATPPASAGSTPSQES